MAAEIWVLSCVLKLVEWTADGTATLMLLMDMRVLLRGATVLRRFDYSKYRYFVILAMRDRELRY